MERYLEIEQLLLHRIPEVMVEDERRKAWKGTW